MLCYARVFFLMREKKKKKHFALLVITYFCYLRLSVITAQDGTVPMRETQGDGSHEIEQERGGKGGKSAADGASDLVAISGGSGVHLASIKIPGLISAARANVTQVAPPALLAFANQFGVGEAGGLSRIGLGAIEAKILRRIQTHDEERVPDFMVTEDRQHALDPPSRAGDTSIGVVTHPCYVDILRYVTDLDASVSYSLKMASSWGDPTVIISGLFSGNFKSFGIMEQCIDVKKSDGAPINGQYCTLHAPFWAKGDYLPIHIELGTCWPQSCSSHDLKNVIYTVLSEVITNATRIHVNCIKEVPWSDGAIATLFILSCFGALVLVGTVYELFRRTRAVEEDDLDVENKSDGTSRHGDNPREDDMKRKDHACENEGFDEDEVTKDKDDSESVHSMERIKVGNGHKAILDRLLFSFSAINNSKKILSCSQPSSALRSLNGIRVLSMSWIVTAHTIQLVGFTFIDNPALTYDNYLRHYTFWAVWHAIYAVDSFFFMSGLLITYLTLQHLNKSKGRMNWALFYFHRFWRITPLYMVVLAIWVTLTVHMGVGPDKTEQFESARDICRDYWWTNLLYINNLYPFPGSIGGQCMGWSWYLANDMQFFIITPVLLILLYKYWIRGIASIIVLFLVSFGSTVGVTLYWGLGYAWTSLYNDRSTELERGADILYEKPYTRIPPYLVGMLLGFVFSRMKRQQVNLDKLLSTVFWTLALVVTFATVYGADGTKNNPRPPQIAAVLYNTFASFAFAVSLAWIVFACETGNGGLINSFLSQSFWVPLGRLTFATYLIHPVLIFVYVSTKTTMFHWTSLEIAFLIVAVVVVSFSVAYVLAILIEGPMVGIEKALTGGRKKADKTASRKR